MEPPVILNPVLADAVIAYIQEGLKENLPWLDVAFGRAERIVKHINGRNLYLPAIYTGNDKNFNEYIELSPDANIGNFSFFWMLEPQRLTWRPKIQGTFRDPFALIFWVDLRKVHSSRANRNIMSLEAEILRVLNGGFKIPIGSLSIDRIYHLAENIYREFTLNEVDNQFLMHPYTGFRFEGELIYDEPCYNTSLSDTWYLLTSTGDYLLTADGERIIVKH